MKLATFGLLATLVFFPLFGKTVERPNILFVFTDDHAPHAIGAYNGWLKSVNPTPVIDKARKGWNGFRK